MVVIEIMSKKFLASLGRRPTAAQKRDLIAKRDALQKRQAKFEKSILAFIQKHPSADEDDESSSSDGNNSEDDFGSNGDDDPPALDLSDLEEENEEDWEDEDGNTDEADIQATVHVEHMRLSLPSNLKKVQMPATLRATLEKQEAMMREGQINDALQKLRLALGAKAWRLRNDVRDARGGKGKTRAWDGVKTKDLEVRKNVQIYSQARAALQRMGMGG
ncbi:hypothetical protein MVEN_01454700 [Mycena venus]|uniref:Uncharacterized protein n=1 Tax=Mycena venus TaxID=2733690 RepID=A0A8H6XV86_9AGAR|nr:hypothetical protein MVEN_01454700 [Mycena venus]